MGLYGTAKNELKGVLDNRYVAWGAIITVGYIGIRFVNGGMKGLGAIGDGVNNLIIKNKVKATNPGVTNADYDTAQNLADGLARAFGKYKTSNPNSSWDEDEDKICSLINSISSAQQGALVKQIYTGITGFDLYANYEAYVHWPDGANTLQLSYIK